MRSRETTDRGISSKKKPTTRSGMARRENSVAASTRSPGVAEPRSTSQAPTSTSMMVPTVGRASMRGSKVPRIRPTRTRSARSSSDAARSRSISARSRPRVFTTRAPSKLSWATADTSPTRRWTTAEGISTRRV